MAFFGYKQAPYMAVCAAIDAVNESVTLFDGEMPGQTDIPALVGPARILTLTRLKFVPSVCLNTDSSSPVPAFLSW